MEVRGSHFGAHRLCLLSAGSDRSWSEAMAGPVTASCSPGSFFSFSDA